MRISAVMGAYNAAPYVGAAVESVLAQTMPPFEIIVVDDGSTDGTGDVLRAFGDRIRLIETENRGAPTAFATAVAEASGEGLAFNDADDLWAPTKLAVQSALLAADPGIDAVFGTVQQFASPDWAEGAAFGAFPPQPGVSKIGIFVRREAFLRTGSFDPSYRLMDFPDWYARASLAGLRAAHHPDLVAHRRLHAGNVGRLRRDEARNEQLLVLKRRLDLSRRAAGRPPAPPE
ncbi:hypothetical protein ASG52_21620 [Methylobacterium sp. Leaf456]|uniref:glycosyltransferase family 2 protein n=1 Tax=Methylobacterium sp. Leaf456 TaxID=1736382 RepID=UPI0006FE4B37|nr:glycosyltransferase family A protein [Methylobacterium sp. Leaf456]KQT58461.1 hypothetical protein ASG52_21620 [Methylobacterium sp. Leaf456]